MVHPKNPKWLVVKSYHRVGEHETRTKAVPTCEFIGEKKSAKAEEASAASVTRYSPWIMSIIKAKSALLKVPTVMDATSD